MNTTYYPGALAVKMGHWFHPVDDLQPGLGHVGGPRSHAVFPVLTVLAALLDFWSIDAATVSNGFPSLMVVLGMPRVLYFLACGIGARRYSGNLMRPVVGTQVP